jgi:hypothetical protein
MAAEVEKVEEEPAKPAPPVHIQTEEKEVETTPTIAEQATDTGTVHPTASPNAPVDEFTLLSPMHTWDEEAQRLAKELGRAVVALGRESRSTSSSSASASAAGASANSRTGMSEDGHVTEVRDAAHMADIVSRAQVS